MNQTALQETLSPSMTSAAAVEVDEIVKVSPVDIAALARATSLVHGDCLIQSAEYLQETVVPHGGE